MDAEPDEVAVGNDEVAVLAPGVGHVLDHDAIDDKASRRAIMRQASDSISSRVIHIQGSSGGGLLRASLNLLALMDIAGSCLVRFCLELGDVLGERGAACANRPPHAESRNPLWRAK